jgi:hypothetical protein
LAGARHTNNEKDEQMKCVDLAIRNKDVARQCRNALAAGTDYRVTEITEAALIAATGADILIICHDTMRRAYTTDPALPLQLMRRMWVVQALCRRDLRARGSQARYAHGWLFIDEETPLLPEIIRMSGDGYCVVPAPIVSRFAKSPAGSPKAGHLTPLERAALRQLMRGNSAAVAGKNLGLPKSAAADLLRAVWRKCGWPTMMRPSQPLGDTPPV